jgi:ribonuclease H2 subunit B
MSRRIYGTHFSPPTSLSIFLNRHLFVGSSLPSSRSFVELDAHLKGMEDEFLAIAIANSNTGSKPKKVAEPKPSDDKKRKLQTKTSQGVEKLKKVNTNGMAKMSSFFKKAA